MLAKKLVCVNCGKRVLEISKKYGNCVKVASCSNCSKLVDQYVEFEVVIVLVDIMLLSKPVYRHLIYNRNFKLFWKLTIMLLLVDSYTLWMQNLELTTSNISNNKSTETVTSAMNQMKIEHQQVFYTCCLQNIIDFLSYTCLLLLVTCTYRKIFNNIVPSNISSKDLVITMLKAHSLANFSKFFLLPIALWRDNTTDLGATLHMGLVMGHHLCSLIFAYSIVSNINIVLANFTVIPVYIIKEYFMVCIRNQLGRNF